MPNIPYLLIDGLWHLALALWVGGSAITTFVAAPTVFRLAPSRALAGEIVGEILRRQGQVTVVALLLASAAGGARAAIWENPVWPMLLRYGFFGAAAILALLGAVWPGPKIHALRSAMGRPIDEVPQSDPHRQAFRRLHGLSMIVNLLQLLLVSLVLFLG